MPDTNVSAVAVFAVKGLHSTPSNENSTRGFDVKGWGNSQIPETRNSHQDSRPLLTLIKSWR